MARTAMSKTAFIDAWKTLSFEHIQDTAKKEASRQVNEMVKWMDWQIKHDPDMMKEIHQEQGIFELVRRSRRYREIIYNRRKKIEDAVWDKTSAEATGSTDEWNKANDRIADYEDEQWAACRRILKIYCHVLNSAGGTLELLEPEEVDFEYDPED